MEIKYVECSCQSMEHVLRFMYDAEQEVTLNLEAQEILGVDTPQYPIWDDVYVEVHLNSELNFFQRLKVGINYIIGRPTGNWRLSELAIIDRKEKLPELIKFLEDVRDYKAPCPLSHEPNVETLQAIKDVEDGVGLTRCENTEDMFRRLNLNESGEDE
jgi:hypothetical protein